MNADPIYKLTFAGETSIIITSAALTTELCDESRFHKHIFSALDVIRAGAHDGLFTARDEEKNWQLAHRLLVPAFGPLKIRAMFPQMHEIAQQLCLKWSRYGPTTPLNLADDFTRATLDTIALCSMGFRFNSFYFDGNFHPFVNSMVGFLNEAEAQSTFPSIVNQLRWSAKRKFKHDIDKMRKICQGLINQRKGTPPNSHGDLLDVMLNTRDTASGEAMTHESIIDNMVTFLIAGHETTSGLLAFTMHYLITSPEEMKKAVQEVDNVVGQEELTVDHISQLKYLTAILRESLRLMPTAPAWTVTPYVKEVIGGKWEVNPGDALVVFLPSVHRDFQVYGPEPNEFRPERMKDENFKKLPPNSWKPFGNGKRGCIGRAFAWQEALLILAMILQRFDFDLVDKSYTLKIKETLTMKPENLNVYATPRNGHEKWMSSFSEKAHPPVSIGTVQNGIQTQLGSFKPATILYGSNSGTCEALAHRLATHLASRNALRSQVKPLDDSVGRLPRNEPVIIVACSYDGSPPMNAVKFLEWLENGKENSLDDIRFAVFGTGHRDWARTFHKIPNLINTLMETCGAKRFAKLGTADTSEDDPFAELEMWEEQYLWPGLESEFDLAKIEDSEGKHEVHIQIGLPHRPRSDYGAGIVRSNRILTAEKEPKKIHVEIELPSGFEYQPGDHLQILPLNSRESVQRVLSRFQLGWDALLNIVSAGATNLPTEGVISAADLLSGYVELGQLATPMSLNTLAAKASDTESADFLRRLATDDYLLEVREKRLSMIDILVSFPLIPLKLEEYLQMIPPLRPRFYTISSSPQTKAGYATLTISVVDGSPSIESRQHRGIASNYLLETTTGSIVRLSLKKSNPLFHVPADPSTRPIIMVTAGSGLAPFRAFVQQRSIQKHAGLKLAPAILFFGCRESTADDLYREELEGFEEEGVVSIYRSYSRQKEQTEGCRYVQERLWLERANVTNLWDQGATVFVCGGIHMTEDVKSTFCQIVSESELPSSRYIAEAFT
ncbi:unnamed protein product [Penicillium olsonii]|nr:unnamed protein product [Penicillium olsonii]